MFGELVTTKKQIPSSSCAKSAALPASNIAEIAVPFRGRTLKVAGDRTLMPGQLQSLMMKTSCLEMHLKHGCKVSVRIATILVLPILVHT
jgi:hypothetical protein